MTIPGSKIDEYAVWLKESGKSDHTIINYVKAAYMFVEWFLSRNADVYFDPVHVSALDLQEYKKFLLQDAKYLRGNTSYRYSIGSIRNFLNSIKTYFDFMMEQKLIPLNPTLKVQLPKTQSDYEEPRWLDRRERSRLLNYIESPSLTKNEWKYARNKAIIFTGLHAGLRRSEIVNLQEDDISFEKAYLFVRSGKGGKSRWIPMNTDLMKALDEWMKIRGDLDHPYVFVSQRGGKLSTQALWHLTEAIGTKIGIDNLTPHVLRHTFAHDLAMNGFPLQRIADLLGHSNLNYTRVYLRSSKEEMRAAVESVSGERRFER